jgi:hypothetical protein
MILTLLIVREAVVDQLKDVGRWQHLHVRVIQQALLQLQTPKIFKPEIRPDNQPHVYPSHTDSERVSFIHLFRFS